jgi:endoglucanase
VLKIALLALLLVNVCFAQSITAGIKLNQLGFYPNAPKLAIVTGNVIADNFYITSTNLRDTSLPAH